MDGLAGTGKGYLKLEHSQTPKPPKILRNVESRPSLRAPKTTNQWLSGENQLSKLAVGSATVSTFASMVSLGYSRATTS